MKQRNTDRIWNVLAAVIMGLLVLTEGLLLFWLGKLDMLPGLYFGILSGVCILITALLGLMLFRRRAGRWQKKQRYTKQIIALLLCLVLIAGCFVGNLAVSKLYGTITNITNITKINVLLEVYVRIDDPAQYIQDTADYTFALADTTEAEDADQAVTELESLLGTQLSVVNYPTAFDMIDALYAGEVDAIILDSSYLSVMDSLEGYSDFSDRARTIHEYVIEKEVASETPAGSAQFKDSNTPFLVYISGNDARKELLADGGSDVNILVAVNPVTKQVLLVNTPRDYYVANPAGNGAKDKLSHCGLNGIQNCIGAITGLYGLDIDYYARINFTGFRTLVDALGGVTVNSDVSFVAGGKYTIHQGENYLDGAAALAFARERKALAGGDNDRGKNQMKLISAIINQLSASNLLAGYTDILDSLEGMFTTSMPAETISELVQMQLSEMPSWDVLSFAVTGDNGNDTCWAVGGGYGYVMYPHEDEVAFASDLISRVLDGEVLTQEDLVLPAD